MNNQLIREGKVSKLENTKIPLDERKDYSKVNLTTKRKHDTIKPAIKAKTKTNKKGNKMKYVKKYVKKYVNIVLIAIIIVIILMIIHTIIEPTIIDISPWIGE